MWTVLPWPKFPYLDGSYKLSSLKRRLVYFFSNGDGNRYETTGRNDWWAINGPRGRCLHTAVDFVKQTVLDLSNAIHVRLAVRELSDLSIICPLLRTVFSSHFEIAFFNRLFVTYILSTAPIPRWWVMYPSSWAFCFILKHNC